MKDAVYDPETKTITGGSEVYVPDPKGLGHAFYTHMKRNRKCVGQIDTETGYRDYFDSMLKRSIRTAIEMKNRGVMAGDIISICSSNNLENYIPFISAQMIGAIVASLDPTISLVDTEHLIKQVDPKLIFVSTNAEKLIEDALNNTGIAAEIVVIGESNKHSEFREFLQPKDDENAFEPYEVDDITQTAVILFSSGTTGLSKGICIHHFAMAYQAYVFTSSSEFEIMVGFASTYWISTVIMICVNQIFGKTRCIIPTFSAKELWYHIEKYQVSFIFLAPSQAIQILKTGRPEGVNTTSLRVILVGGGPLSSENNIALRDLMPGTHMHMIYGQSEAAGLVTNFRSTDRKDILLFHEKPSSCGRPMLGMKYKIVDPETEEALGPNERGELRYFARCQMNGYYKRESSDAFDEEGWVRSGDIGYFDDDLCFYIVDRIKEMLKFQAFHIPPARIEGVLLSHPKVAVAVVIGIPDEDDGDHPMGLVILQPGSNTTAEELVKYVEDRVDDRHRLRAGVKIVDSVPYTPSGKIKKQILRKMVLAGEL